MKERIKLSKFRIFISIGALGIGLIVALIWFSLREPEIKVRIKLSNVTLNDLSDMDQLYQSKLKDNPLQDIKKLNVSVNIYNSFNIKERKVQIPDLIYVLDHYDHIRTIKGGSSEKSNIMELTSEFTKCVYFNSTGLDNYTIRNIFQQSNINIELTSIFGKHYYFTYPIEQNLY